MLEPYPKSSSSMHRLPGARVGTGDANQACRRCRSTYAAAIGTAGSDKVQAALIARTAGRPSFPNWLIMSA